MDRLNDQASAVVKKKSVKNDKGKQINVRSPQCPVALVTCRHI